MEVKGQLISSPTFNAPGQWLLPLPAAPSLPSVSVCLLGGGVPDPTVAPGCSGCPDLCSPCAAALFGEAAPQVKSERLRGLLDRRQALQEALRLKLQELRKVCLQEAVRAWPQGYQAQSG